MWCRWKWCARAKRRCSRKKRFWREHARVKKVRKKRIKKYVHQSIWLVWVNISTDQLNTMSSECWERTSLHSTNSPYGVLLSLALSRAHFFFFFFLLFFYFAHTRAKCVLSWRWHAAGRGDKKKKKKRVSVCSLLFSRVICDPFFSWI